MPLPYIKVVHLNKRTKKSWWRLVQKALKTWDFDGYLYIYQKSDGWESINYQNLLRAVRRDAKPKFRPISQAQWWLDHRLSCYKRGIKIPLETAINYSNKSPHTYN